MKFKGFHIAVGEAGSRPARGAWVEMKVVRMQTLLTPSRAPQGARGLKLFNAREWQAVNAVAPRKGRVG